MTFHTHLLLATWIIGSLSLVHGFAPVAQPAPRPTTTALHLLPEFHNLLLATIDSDIANIPTNEFRTVFLGGLGVMAGGLISAVAVGAMLEASDGYAAVVAESYDLEADEEFWKGLSDEEAKKAREMLAKVKAQRGEAVSESAGSSSTVVESGSPSGRDAKMAQTNPSVEPTKEAEAKKQIDMFSDY